MSSIHNNKLSPKSGPRKETLRVGVFVRGEHADQLREMALRYDTQPGRVANRLLCEALDLAARGQREGR